MLRGSIASGSCRIGAEVVSDDEVCLSADVPQVESESQLGADVGEEAEDAHSSVDTHALSVSDGRVGETVAVGKTTTTTAPSESTIGVLFSGGTPSRPSAVSRTHNTARDSTVDDMWAQLRASTSASRQRNEPVSSPPSIAAPGVSTAVLNVETRLASPTASSAPIKRKRSSLIDDLMEQVKQEAAIESKSSSIPCSVTVSTAADVSASSFPSPSSSSSLTATLAPVPIAAAVEVSPSTEVSTESLSVGEIEDSDPLFVNFKEMVEFAGEKIEYVFFFAVVVFLMLSPS